MFVTQRLVSERKEAQGIIITFNLRNIFEKYLEIDGDVQICPIDYSKAFDCERPRTLKYFSENEYSPKYNQTNEKLIYNSQGRRRLQSWQMAVQNRFEFAME